MPRKHHKPEEIVAKLRQVGVLTSQGKSVADAILDCLVHNAHRIELVGESLRRTKERQTRRA